MMLARQLPFVALTISISAPSFASEEEGLDLLPLFGELTIEEERLEVIQNRKYAMSHEFVVLGGTLPADPFYKGVTVTAGYTYHFSDAIAWEILQGTYSFNFDTSLKRQLVQLAQARPDGMPPDLPEIQWMAATHLVIKPFYGKEAVLNSEVMHLEIFAQLGGAVVSRLYPHTKKNDLAPGLDLGFGLRLWLAEAVSLRLDVGEMIYVEGIQNKPKVYQALHLHLGFAFSVRSED